VACIPHDSLQFDAVWYHNYQKYQHTDFSTETNKKITEYLLFINLFETFIGFRSLGTIKTISNDGHKILSKIYVHEYM